MELPASLELRREGRDGEVGVLTLARPGKRNALDDATVEALGRFFEEPPAGVGVVVLDAQGNHFSAGLDLSELAERDAISFRGFYLRRARRLLPALFLVLVATSVLAMTVAQDAAQRVK